MRESFLFLPASKHGSGTGHLRRALRLAGRIGGLRRTAVYLPPEAEEAARFAKARLPKKVSLLREEPAAGEWDFLVFDRRATAEAEYTAFLRLGVPLGIDEGGPLRELFPYLIDTLPMLQGTPSANAASTGYLEVPPQLRQRPERIERVLISFGGEDPAGLSGPCLDALLEAGFSPRSLTVVKGALFGPRRFPPGVRVLDAPESLEEHYVLHDLVCTSFGMTAFEAAAAGCLVLLIHPERYHRKLADAAGFVSAGVGGVDRRRFFSALSRPERLRGATEIAAPPQESESIEGLLLSLRRPIPEACPVCGRRLNTPLRREEQRSFFYCRDCAAVYQADFGERGTRYAERYFFEEYRRQYGRTYLEDADHIRAVSVPRVGRIQRLLQPADGAERVRSPRLLDVGCAYGPFLEAAAAGGFRAEGVEIASAAAEYVRRDLGFTVHTGAFEEYSVEEGGIFDAVTMWFVIEHFRDLDMVLRRAGRLLRSGGVFAFSTPNLKGGSGRLYPQHFLAGSPCDHFSLWYPRMARRVLKRYGFTVRKIVVTGHHPERLPGGCERMGLLRRGLLTFISRLARLGDTFEVYACKTGEPR